MPFHFCSDELFMILAMLPFIGVFFKRIHNWWHTKFGHNCHEGPCQSNHVDHNESMIVGRTVVSPGAAVEVTQIHLSSSARDALNLPPEDSFTFTMDKLWDAANWDYDLYDLISKEDLQERLGPIADKLIQKLEFDLDMFLNTNEFRWFINGHSRVRATFRGRNFLHDEFSIDNTWSEIKR